MPRDVWSVECGPADIHGSDMVCGSSIPAVTTKEDFTLPISLSYVATSWTGSASVPWVNEEKRDSCETSLVLNKGAELVESPTMDRPALAASINRYPVSDALQLFEGYSSEGVLSLLNDPLADKVVHRCSEPAFLSTSLL